MIQFDHQPVDETANPWMPPNSSAQTGCSCGPNGRKLAPRGRGKGGNVFVLGTGVAFCTSHMRSVLSKMVFKIVLQMVWQYISLDDCNKQTSLGDLWGSFLGG